MVSPGEDSDRGAAIDIGRESWTRTPERDLKILLRTRTAPPKAKWQCYFFFFYYFVDNCYTLCTCSNWWCRCLHFPDNASSTNLSCCWGCHPKAHSDLDCEDPLVSPASDFIVLLAQQAYPPLDTWLLVYIIGLTLEAHIQCHLKYEAVYQLCLFSSATL